ncbi:MAG: hypothetical protein AAFW84_16180 [Cyanobacteria bacterium J06635_15]
MTDDRRAKELKDYLLSNLIGEPELSWRSIGHVLLGLPLDDENTINKAKKIKFQSVGELVEIISHIKKAIAKKPDGLYLSGKGNKKIDLNVSQPTEEAISRAFQILGQLTWQERHAINLSTGDHDILAKQALLNLAHYHDQQGQKRILELYKASIGVDFSAPPSVPFNSLSAVNQYIDALFSKNSSSYLASLYESLDDYNLKLLQKKVKNAVTRLLLQAGTGQIRFINVNDQDSYVEKYLIPVFIERVTQVVSENNLLNQDFPIYLQNITLNHPGPLPLPRQKEGQQQGLFHKALLELRHPTETAYERLYSPIDENLEQLLSRPASQIICEFCVRFENSDSDTYQPFSSTVYENLKSQTDGHVRVHFTIQSTGLGGTLSQIIRVINAALFWDINCLKETYFPIAHDILINQEIIHSNIPSPVWSHSLVKLCRNKTIEEALRTSRHSLEEADTDEGQDTLQRQGIRPYEEFAFIDPVGRGDYCDFDSLVSSGKAALQARLQAIKNAGIPAQIYKNDLLRRVEQQYILQEAKNLVRGYPFSALAMESWLKTELLMKLNSQTQETFSYSVFDAYLTLAETFISEGAYRKAYEYLNELRHQLAGLSDKWISWCRSYADTTQQDEIERDNDFAFSGSLLVRYELCVAEYFYILDWRKELKVEEEKFFLDISPSERVEDIVEKAWLSLDRAEQLLTLRLAKYHVVNEISQATFHPYYYLLSRIYLLRAKMLLFYPTLAGLFMDVTYRPPTDYPFRAQRTSIQQQSARLFLLERARLYAICDGDSELYIIHTAYHGWALLMASFVADDVIKIEVANQTVESFSKDCLARAQQLRNHALLQYAEIGRRCYHEIKEQSGLSEEFAAQHREFGGYEIDPIPAIRETIGEHLPGYQIVGEASEDIEVLYLDMQLLTLHTGWVDPDNPKSTQLIYLFGPRACYLFFIRGLCYLCSDEKAEFPKQGITSENLRGLNAWDEKLEHCYRLFNYAWAMADDGCTIEQVASEENQWKIKRFAHKGMGMIPDPHAASVWDLYPYRVTEIVDLGKVFAAACAALRLYTSETPLDRDIRQKEVKWLLEGLHREHDFQTSPALIKALHGQRRYNGHLEVYFEQCKQKIENIIDKAQPNLDTMLEVRHELLRGIFELNA